MCVQTQLGTGSPGEGQTVPQEDRKAGPCRLRPEFTAPREWDSCKENPFPVGKGSDPPPSSRVQGELLGFCCRNDSSLGGRGEPEAGPAVPMGSRERECGEATGLMGGHQTCRRNRCPKPRPQSKSVALFGCFPTALRPWLPRTNQKIKTTRAPGTPIFAVNFLSFLRVETVSGILTVSVTRGAHTGFTASLGEEGI